MSVYVVCLARSLSLSLSLSLPGDLGAVLEEASGCLDLGAGVHGLEPDDGVCPLGRRLGRVVAGHVSLAPAGTHVEQRDLSSSTHKT